MSKINRRKFFAGVGTGLVGLGIAKGTPVRAIGSTGSSTETEEPKIKKYNKLGKTDLKVSDIIFGSTSFLSPNVARYAYDMGVNTFDTAENYMNGRSEEMVGRALKGIRKNVNIITKHFGRRNPNDKFTKKDLIEKFNQSLKRLQTDYIDVAFTHAVQSPDFWKNEELLGAYEQLKKDGKLRYSGFSTHNEAVMLKACLAPEFKEFVQVCMFRYNHMEGKPLEPMIAALHKRGIGTIAMKTLAGGRHENLKSVVKGNMSYPQAALGWVLGNSAVDCAVISMRSFSHAEEYVAASGNALAREDLATLNNYQHGVKKEYCRVTCDKCEKACPQNVAISDIMRFEMYFKDYGHEKEAIREYAFLDNKKKPLSCASCSGKCTSACPFGLDVKGRLLDTHDILTV